MARIFTCGWENGGNSEAAGVDAPGTNASFGVSTAVVRSGTYALKRTGANAGSHAALYRSAVTNERTFHRFYLYIGTAPSGTEIIYRFQSGGNFRGGIAVKSDRSITLLNQSSVEIGTASAALNLATWYRIEIDITADATPLMTATVRVDGTDFTSGTTWTPTTAGLNTVSFAGSGTLTGVYYIDDHAINDTSGTVENSWPGAGSVVYLRATGDGDANTGGPTRGGTDSGALWSQVDEVLINAATDYVVLPANPSDFWINVQNGSVFGIGASDTIKLVEVHGQVAGASSSASNWFPQIKKAASGTIASASAVAMAVSTFFVNDDTVGSMQCRLVRHSDPDGTSWTPSTIDSMQISARTTDGNPDTWVSALWAIVEYIPAEVAKQRQTVVRQAIARSNYH